MDTLADQQNTVISNLTATMSDAVTVLDTYLSRAKAVTGKTLAPNGKPDRGAFKTYQQMAHGLAWVTTYIETLREVSNWAKRLEESGQFGDIEQLLSQILFSEYISQLMGGIPMNQGEMVRPADLGLLPEDMKTLSAPSLQNFIKNGKTPEVMAQAARHLPAALDRATVEETGLDETMTVVRDQFRKFANDKVKPYAHEWHLKN